MLRFLWKNIGEIPSMCGDLRGCAENQKSLMSFSVKDAARKLKWSSVRQGMHSRIEFVA